MYFEKMWPLFFNLFFERDFEKGHVMVHGPSVSECNPTHQWADISFGIPRSLQTVMSGTSPIHQQANTRSWNHSLQPPMIEPGSAHQWTITSPGTSQGSTASHLLTQAHQSAAGHLHIRQSGNQPDWEPAMPTKPPTILSPTQQKGPCSPHRWYH